MVELKSLQPTLYLTLSPSLTRLLAPKVAFSERASWNEGQSVLLAGVNELCIRRGAVQLEFVSPLKFEIETFWRVARSTPVELV